MPNKNITLKPETLRRAYFRMSQMQLVGGRLAAVLALMKRTLTTWPELAPGADDAVANALDVNTLRTVLITAEEQSAVCDGFIRLCNSDRVTVAGGAVVSVTMGMVMEFLKDLEIFGKEMRRHVENRLGGEKLEPFVEDVPEDGEADENLITRTTD